MTSLEDGLLLAIALGDTLHAPRRVFMTKTFGRWLRKTTLAEQDLCEAVAQIAAGLVDAKLGGCVFKKRIAASGRGKRGSARVLIGTNLGGRWFFLYGFEKNERSNVDARELGALQKLAGVLLKLDASRLSIELECGNLQEICHETQSHTQ